MSRIKIIEPLVQEILENNKETRSDDFLLVTYVFYRIEPSIAKSSFSSIMLCHKELGLPSIASIFRARRKIFEKHPELNPKKIKELREQEEQEYRNYAKDLN